MPKTPRGSFKTEVLKEQPLKKLQNIRELFLEGPDINFPDTGFSGLDQLNPRGTRGLSQGDTAGDIPGGGEGGVAGAEAAARDKEIIKIPRNNAAVGNMVVFPFIQMAAH